MGNIVQLNETEIKMQLGEMVRKTVEDTLNAMLDHPCRIHRRIYPSGPQTLHLHPQNRGFHFGNQ